jgi:hypothetical protein
LWFLDGRTQHPLGIAVRCSSAPDLGRLPATRRQWPVEQSTSQDVEPSGAPSDHDGTPDVRAGGGWRPPVLLELPLSDRTQSAFCNLDVSDAGWNLDGGSSGRQSDPNDRGGGVSTEPSQGSISGSSWSLDSVWPAHDGPSWKECGPDEPGWLREERDGSMWEQSCSEKHARSPDAGSQGTWSEGEPRSVPGGAEEEGVSSAHAGPGRLPSGDAGAGKPSIAAGPIDPNEGIGYAYNRWSDPSGLSEIVDGADEATYPAGSSIPEDDYEGSASPSDPDAEDVYPPPTSEQFQWLQAELRRERLEVETLRSQLRVDTVRRRSARAEEEENGGDFQSPGTIAPGGRYVDPAVYGEPSWHVSAGQSAERNGNATEAQETGPPQPSAWSEESVVEEPPARVVPSYGRYIGTREYPLPRRIVEKQIPRAFKNPARDQ